MKSPSLALASLVLLATGGLATAQESARQKIATVDMETLYREYQPTKDAVSKFEEEKTAVTKQMDERRARLEEAKKELESLQKKLNDPSIADAKKKEIFTERQVKQGQAEGLLREAEEFGQRKSRAMMEQVRLRTKVLLEEIRDKVQKLAEAEGYDFVLDRTGTSTSQVPILLYTKDATDITEQLLKTINEGTATPAKTE